LGIRQPRKGKAARRRTDRLEQANGRAPLGRRGGEEEKVASASQACDLASPCKGGIHPAGSQNGGINPALQCCLNSKSAIQNPKSHHSHLGFSLRSSARRSMHPLQI